MSRRRKLIVVSNRGPVTYGRDASGERVARRGGGGLVTALRSLVELHDVTWIATSRYVAAMPQATGNGRQCDASGTNSAAGPKYT